jgi:hypothetical protein
MKLLVSKRKLIIALLLIILIVSVLVIFNYRYFIALVSELNRSHWKKNISIMHHTLIHTPRSQNDTVETSRTLIVYVFGETHESSEQNLAFFVRNAVRESHDADYYFILQQINKKIFDKRKLPKLPSNAQYIQHENKCFDLGSIGWFLSSGMIERSKYKYFIFLNSSVRGPFIVSYYDSPIWYTIFTRRLNEHIKLVGCTINCERSPHVQSYLLTLSPDTFDFLLKNSTVFDCHLTQKAAVDNGEIVANQMILKSGYGIDSLMRKYQGIDFRLNVSEKCSNLSNPTGQKSADGIILDPFEVVFVKTKYGPLLHHDNYERLLVYEKWVH